MINFSSSSFLDNSYFSSTSSSSSSSSSSSRSYSSSASSSTSSSSSMSLLPSLFVSASSSLSSFSENHFSLHPRKVGKLYNKRKNIAVDSLELYEPKSKKNFRSESLELCFEPKSQKRKINIPKINRIELMNSIADGCLIDYSMQIFRTQCRLLKGLKANKTETQKRVINLLDKIENGVRIQKRAPFRMDLTFERINISLKDQKKYLQLAESRIEIKQAQFKVISSKKHKGLFTKNVKTCVAVAALAFNKNYQLIGKGLAHYDGSRKLIEKLFAEFKRLYNHFKVLNVELYLVGSTGEYHHDDIMEQIEYSKSINPKLKIRQIDTYYNCYRVDEGSREFELHSDEAFDVMGLDLTVGLTRGGGIYMQKDSLFKEYFDGDFRIVNTFLQDDKLEILSLVEDFLRRGEKNQRTLIVLKKLLMENPQEWLPSHSTNFLNNIRTFLSSL